MFSTKYRYPGDPVEPVNLMFGGEFKARNPNRFIEVSGGNMPTSRITVDEVICDHCNAEVFDTEPCAVTQRRLYCWECYTEWVKPHLVKS